MKVGFTGTRRGMSQYQFERIAAFIDEHDDITEFHHGDCVGADAEAHDIFEAIDGCTIVIHPPKAFRHRAFKHERYFFISGKMRLHKPLPYLERNHALVDATDMLVATPFEDKEIRRSGTWATIRYAQLVDKPIYIILG